MEAIRIPEPIFGQNAARITRRSQDDPESADDGEAMTVAKY
jgi:hypothetical protein